MAYPRVWRNDWVSVTGTTAAASLGYVDEECVNGMMSIWQRLERSMKWLVIGGMVLAVGASGLAMAQSAGPKPDEIIAIRQGGMALQGGIAEAMKAGVATGAEVKPFVDGAEAYVKWGNAYPSLFPDGTQTGHETKAKPEIWSDRAGFEKANAAFVGAAEKLVSAAKSGDKAVFAAAFKETGAACGGCHRNYKAR